MNRRAVLVLTLLLSTFTLAENAYADKFPVVPGDYWEVTGIKLKDGGSFAYAKFLADDFFGQLLQSEPRPQLPGFAFGISREKM